MLWRVFQRDAHVLLGLLQRLLRQRIHQIEVDVVKVILRNVYRTSGLISIMDAPQRFQMRLVKTLYAQRQSVHTGIAKALEFIRLDRAGIGFQRNFGIDIQRQQHAHRAENSIHRLRRKQAGRTAADKHAVYLAPPDQWQRHFQVANQRIDIGCFRHFTARLMRIEIAVGTFAHAPGNMDIQRQRGQGLKIDGLVFKTYGIKLVSSPSSFSFCSNIFIASARWLT
jgi:hypothetical protein